MRRIALSGLVAAAVVLGCSVSALAGTTGHSVAPAAAVADAARAASATWTSGDGIGKGNQVSCASTTSCLAVGDDVNSRGNLVPIAESLHAGTWKAVSTTKAPGYSALTSELTGVSCKAATYCLAVGQYDSISLGTTPYAMTWNGNTLAAVVKLPLPSTDYLSALGPVSCLAVKSCVVFGSGPDISLSSSGNPVVAVYAWTWNGSKWSLSATPVSGNELAIINSARCFSPKSCVLAGSTTPLLGSASTITPLLVTWNGKSLTGMNPIVPSDMKQAEFVSVSCSATTSCAATGVDLKGNDASAFLDVTDGKGWNLTKWGGPSGATSAALTGVSCVSRSNCVAAGGIDTAKTSLAAALTWNGTKWTVTKVPGPGTGKMSIFYGVSCSAAGNCTAIGETGKATAEVGSQFAGHWSGSAWKLTAA